MTDAAPLNQPSRTPDDFENTVLGEDLDAALAKEGDPNFAAAAYGGTAQLRDAGSFSERFRAAGGDELIAGAVAVLGAVATLAGWREPGILLAILAVVVPAITRRRELAAVNRSIRPTGSFLLPRVLLIVVLATLYPQDRGDAWLVWLGASGLAILTAAESSAAAVARGAIPYAAHLPGVAVRNRRILSAAWVFVANAGALVLLGLICWLGMPGPTAVIPVLLAAPVTVVVLIDGTLRIRSRRIAERTLNRRLAEYGATFLVHWDAPRGAMYQLAMWLPFLEQLGKPFLVVVRHPGNFNGAAERTTAPVLLRRALKDMDALITPSLKTAFYVNTAAKNLQFLRYANLTHIQLNHGDSDKGPSYSRVFRMFDKNFVAGQAAIDRFDAHGITVPRETFSIVGRPQVQAVEVRRASAPGGPRTVLYAPTWSGFHADSNYSSLGIGISIVTALLAHGCRVVFRPHPYTYRNADLEAASTAIDRLLEADARNGGHHHLWGDAARVDRTVFDCFNESDAMITDVSSVAADYLYSEKPFAITAMTAPAAELVTEFPLARAAYILDPGAPSLEPLLGDLLDRDPLEERRHRLKVYYLGDFPPESYADAFLSEARKYV